jgi:hypothetical protein
MSVPLARKLEFLIRTRAPDLDVQVRLIALTLEQVRRYRLPRIPIKDTDRSAPEFERRYGEGATELDALEALRPGELRKIVKKEIERYIDSNLDVNIHTVHREAEDEADDINERIHAEHAAEIEWLRQKHEALAEQAEAFIDRVRKQFEARFRGRFDDLIEREKSLAQRDCGFAGGRSARSSRHRLAQTGAGRRRRRPAIRFHPRLRGAGRSLQRVSAETNCASGLSDG